MTITISPSLRTAGGETCDILLNDQYAGTMTLVYREFDRMQGLVQLDKDVLNEEEKEQVSFHVEHYIQSLIDALDAEDCDVMVTYSSLEHMIGTPHDERLQYEEDWEYDSIDTETTLGDYDHELDDLEMTFDHEFDLIVADEKDNRVEYHIVDHRQQLAADVIATIRDRDVSADVMWRFLPSDDQIEEVTDLIVSDFDDDVIETFLLEMNYKDRILETVQLAHNRLIKNSWPNEEQSSTESEIH